jgi:hypothetical protein
MPPCLFSDKSGSVGSLPVKFGGKHQRVFSRTCGVMTKNIAEERLFSGPIFQKKYGDCPIILLSIYISQVGLISFFNVDFEINLNPSVRFSQKNIILLDYRIFEIILRGELVTA